MEQDLVVLQGIGGIDLRRVHVVSELNRPVHREEDVDPVLRDQEADLVAALLHKERLFAQKADSPYQGLRVRVDGPETSIIHEDPRAKIRTQKGRLASAGGPADRRADPRLLQSVYLHGLHFFPVRHQKAEF